MSSSAHAAPLEPAEHVRRLVEAGRVGEARRFLESAPQDDASLGPWRIALALRPLEFLPTSSGSSERMALNTRWLNAHADEHRGEWVALRDDQLVDADRDASALEDRLPDDRNITVIKIPQA